jgi:UDP:flavonoid glycosyltransferase YjiC (YdhE family)
LNADRVSELGAGLRLRRATPRQIASEADLILGEHHFREAAVRAGAELRGSVDLGGAVNAVLSATRGPH